MWMHVLSVLIGAGILGAAALIILAFEFYPKAFLYTLLTLLGVAVCWALGTFVLRDFGVM